MTEPIHVVASYRLGLWGLVIGAVAGASMGLVRHAMSGGRRDFSSTSTLRAERYDLVADADFAVVARRLLGASAGEAIAVETARGLGRHLAQ